MSRSFPCPKCGKPIVPAGSDPAAAQTCPNCRERVAPPLAEGADQPPIVAGASTKRTMVLMPSESKHQEDLIDMTAMVDIVFFLLIFFMVTSIQSLESVIGLPPPQSSSSAPSTQAADLANDPSFVTVAIEADDTVWVEDEQVFGRQDLRIKLRALRDEGFQPTGMLIQGDPEASHGSLVMVLDAGADAGFQELKFSVADASGGQ